MAGPSVSSRGRSSSPSPFGYRKPYPSSSNSSSSSPFYASSRIVPRSSPSSVSSHCFANGAAAGLPRSVTPGRGRTGSGECARGRPPPPVAFPSADELIAEDTSRSGDSISVTVRFRPMSEREFQRGDEIAWYADADKLVRNEYNPATAYAFDRVFGPATVSKEVYDTAARPVVNAAMDGINGTVFAYGVTSSGKTHTMHGDQNSPGIIPLAIKDVFSIIQDTPGREFLLRVSYLEIYNEVINDLLDPTGQNLRVREDAQGTYVEGIKEEVVLSPGHALSFIAAGEEHRHVGSNNFNLFSSRSHTIFTLMIESSAHGDEYDGVTFSQLNLIDLAGSESSKTETTGLRRKEGSYINKSLLTLGTVIGKLSEGKASHVPYRDSKLTRLLQSSLSGHGHVSLICTVTPASSSMEETHNTLKFASRAKRVEIYASRNRIIDEKSLIKKYQREISTLKQELDQLKQGMITGVNQEEINILKQQLEEGQVKMQYRLEEEEEAKAALMSRIQRLTKLILVSTKNTIPGCLSDVPSHQRNQSSASGDDDKLDVLREVSPLLLESDGARIDSSTSVLSTDQQRRWPGKLNDDQSSISSSITESTQLGDGGGLKMATTGMTKSDQLDLLVEQLKMLAGEIAFGRSTLKRLREQSTNDPDGSKTQIQNLEQDIQEKQRQMRALEQQITELNEASVANASLVDMHQTVTRLMAQCNEKSFELELRTADNRILQEQLQQKCFENQELHEKLLHLQIQLDSVKSEKCSVSSEPSEETEILKRKIQSQDIDNEKLNLDRLQLMEENSGLLIQRQKLAEEASYAKELASAAAVELKNLAEEVTKLSLQNARQAKELLAAQDLAYSRSANVQACNGGLRKYSESKTEATRLGRRSRPNSRGNEFVSRVHDDASGWNLEWEDMKTELQARRQREAALEAALAEKEYSEEEYKRKYEEAKKREASLENDMAGMWVLVAKLKKGVLGASELNVDERPPNGFNNLKENSHRIEDNSFKRRQPSDELFKANGMVEVSEFNVDETLSNGINFFSEFRENNIENNDSILKERQITDELPKPDAYQYNQSRNMEPLLIRLKAQIQEMKEKKNESIENGDADPHMCKVCFEAQSAAVLLPCRHFCLCKPCSFACYECPVCRTEIEDRIITFT